MLHAVHVDWQRLQIDSLSFWHEIRVRRDDDIENENENENDNFYVSPRGTGQVRTVIISHHKKRERERQASRQDWVGGGSAAAWAI